MHREILGALLVVVVAIATSALGLLRDVPQPSPVPTVTAGPRDVGTGPP